VHIRVRENKNCKRKVRKRTTSKMYGRKGGVGALLETAGGAWTRRSSTNLKLIKDSEQEGKGGIPQKKG